MDKWNGSSGTLVQLQNIVFMYLHNEQTNTWFDNIEEDIFSTFNIYVDVEYGEYENWIWNFEYINYSA